MSPALHQPSRRERDQVVLFRGVTWEQYVALAATRGESAVPRMTYLDGELEILSPAPIHEFDTKFIARLVEAWADEKRVVLIGIRSVTLRKKRRKGGLEPDECYCIGRAKPFPDIAIEVVNTRDAMDKLDVYRRLGVAEVWIWERPHLRVFALGEKGYSPIPKSALLPGIDLAHIARLVATTPPDQQAEAVWAFRAALRRKRR